MDHVELNQEAAFDLSSLLAQDKPLQSIECDSESFYARPSHSASQSNSARNSSCAESALFDTEPPEPSTRQNSPPTSHTSDDEISLLPSTRAGSCAAYSPETDRKQTTRPPFRTPSSVRALQLSTTPPHLTSPPPYLHPLPPSRNSTPHSAFRSPSKRLSPGKKVRKEYPLVLLHITILPLSAPWSRTVMERVLSARELEMWKVLGEKVGETVAERGVLIRHPREEYEVLGERLLESLELVDEGETGCGVSFVGAQQVEEDEENGEEVKGVCKVCGKREERRMWEIKVYAANGLMRAGAWGAAWREMERVDVEILPWVSDELRRALEAAREEEEEEMRMREEPLQKLDEDQHHQTGHMDQERWREIYGDEAQVFVDGLGGEGKVGKQRTRRQRAVDESLWVLVRDCVVVAARDRRNLAILFLSFLVMYLSFPSKASTKVLSPLPQAATTPVAHLPEAMSTSSSDEVESAPSITDKLLPLSSIVASITGDGTQHVVPTSEMVRQVED